MLKGLLHGLAWSLATGAAVTLSWWGVHTVLAGTAYDPPRAVPIAGGSGASPRDAKPVSSSTHRPRPSPSSAPRSRTPQPPPPSHSAPPKTKPTRPPSPPASGTGTDPDAGDGVVRGYDTQGGRVVLDIGRTSASLVSATPNPGWSMQVWKEQTWIRVEFSTDSDEVGVFCTWNGHRPQVEIVNY